MLPGAWPWSDAWTAVLEATSQSSDGGVQSHFESHAVSNTSDTYALLVQIMSLLAILHTLKELTSQFTSHTSSSNMITANILLAILHISDEIANARVRSNAQADISEDSSVRSATARSPAGDCTRGEASHHDEEDAAALAATELS